MRINSVSSSTMIPNSLHGNSQVKANNDLFELSKIDQLMSSNNSTVADQKTNSISIKPGEIKNIGSVDGSPLNICFNSDGSMNTSFGIMINENDPIDCPRDQIALKISKSYTSSQMDKANSIIGRFQMLYSVANGSMSVAQYNAKDFGGNTISTSKLLKSLGIDVSKSFSFNGKWFSLDAQGNLQASMTASRLNVEQ